MLLALLRQILIYRAGEEEDDNDGCGDPHGAIQIRVSLEDIEEIGARINGCSAPAQHLCRVDIKGLCVKVEGPEIMFSSAAATAAVAGCGRARQERGRGRVGLDLGCAAAAG